VNRESEPVIRSLFSVICSTVPQGVTGTFCVPTDHTDSTEEEEEFNRKVEEVEKEQF
jgi:hypothetical protein